MGIVSSTYNGTLAGANIFGANDGYLYVAGNSITGPVGSGANVGNLILGATNGQVITWLGNTSTANIITVVGSTGLSVTGVVSATGNVIGGNVTTAGLISATGNITGGNLNFTGNLYIGGTAFIRTLTVGTIGASPVTVPLATNNSFNVLTIASGNVVVYTT